MTLPHERKRTWVNLLRAAHATDNLADVSTMSASNTGLQAVLKFAGAPGAPPVAATSVLELRHRELSGSRGF